MSENNVTIYEDREFMIFNVSELNLLKVGMCLVFNFILN